MKITKTQLKQIIKEELEEFLEEEQDDRGTQSHRDKISRMLKLPPGSVKNTEELTQAEKERKALEAEKPPKPKSNKPYRPVKRPRQFGAPDDRSS